MAIKHELGQAAKILERMYKKFRANISDEQWQAILEEIKQARIKADGVVLEGEELEATAKANVMARLAHHAQSGGRK